MKKTSDLTQGHPGKVLLLFSLPIFIGSLLQQLYATVDSIVVGNFVGAYALGAVGTAFPITFMVTAVATGLSNGAAILVGQSYGSGKTGNLRRIIQVCFWYAVAVALAFTLLCSLLAPSLLGLMNAAPEIYSDALTYLRVYFIGLVFTFSYSMTAAVFRAMGDSKTPLFFLAISSLINIGLDLLFVLRFNMGVYGVAVATVIAQGVSFLLQLLLLTARLRRLAEEEDAPPAPGYAGVVLRQLMSLALPTTIQEIMIAFGVFVMQALVNLYGADASAAYTACGKIENFAMMPMINASIALTAFSAQNMGAGKLDRLREGYRYAIWGTMGLAAVVTALVVLAPRGLMRIFLAADTAENIFVIGRDYLLISAASYFLMALTFSAEGVLRGAGDVKLFTLFSIGSKVAKLGSALLLMPRFGYKGLFVGTLAGWGSEAIMATLRMRSGKWKSKAVVAAQAQACSAEPASAPVPAPSPAPGN